MTNICVSGGFDPIHIGHLRMFQQAKILGNHLIVVVNNDNWLMHKKGFCFMPENDRVEIIEGFSCVDEVMLTDHAIAPEDISVCKELEELAKRGPLIFVNGGDRKQDNIPEYDLCDRLGIEMIFGIGGDKLRSSSDLVKAALKNEGHKSSGDFQVR